MSITAQQIFVEIQLHLLEPTGAYTIPSGLWTPQEVLDALNLRQQQFLKDSLAILKRGKLLTTPMSNRQPLGDECIAIARVYWHGADGVYRDLPRADSFDADAHQLDWELNPTQRPLEYHDSETPTLQLQLAPAAAIPGELHILYAFLALELDLAGIAFSVPDEFVPSIKWGAIATLLKKTGRGQDLVRGEYAESRYRAGVAAAAIMLNGFGG